MRRIFGVSFEKASGSSRCRGKGKRAALKVEAEGLGR
jgi:hypothetical protein